MSAEALLGGVLSVLQGPLILNDPGGRVSGIQPDGEPPAGAGQVYYAVHWLGLTQQDDNPLSLDEVHAAAVTITARLAYAPKDRRGAELAAAGKLLAQARLVGRTLHHKGYAVMAAANALIPGTAQAVAAAGGAGEATANGFVEPLRLQAIDPPARQRDAWVGADGDDEDGEDDVFACVVRLGGARLVMPLDDDT